MAFKINKSLSRLEFILLFGFITSLTALSINAVMPLLSSIESDLGVKDMRNMQMIISIFIMGMALGEFIFGPLADSVGRKPVIGLGILIYALGAVVGYLSKDIYWLVLGRFIQGVGVAGPKIGTRALVRDLYRGDAMASVMSYLLLILVIMPMFIPIVSQKVSDLFGWRAMFLVFVFFPLCLLFWMSKRQAETLPVESRSKFHLKGIFRKFIKIFKHKHVLSYTLIAGVIFGSYISFVNAAQSIFKDIYQKDDKFVYYFSVLALSAGVSFFFSGRFVVRIGMLKLVILSLSTMVTVSFIALVRYKFNDSYLNFAHFMSRS